MPEIILPETNEQVKTPPPKNKRRRMLWIITISILVLAIAWVCYWFLYAQYYESTDDAYANGNLVNINTAISGSVTALYADDTDLVEEGQLLLTLDRTDYQVMYERELAKLGAVVLQVRQLYDTVHSNAANVENRKVLQEKAHFDYQNRLHLIDSGAISNEEFVHSKEDLQSADYNLKQAEYQLQTAKDAAGATPVEKHPLIMEQRANVQEAFYKLYHCNVYAPTTGYVAKRAVDVGEWVTPNTSLMTVIPGDYVWVDANYKERQLRKMRIGQKASVYFDIYGSSVKYEGKVLGIASGSGSVFSLIPPQNATGNWIKIVQRLPVRISLDKETLKDYPIRLGISAQVKVDISDLDLPMLAQVPSCRAIAKTSVFDIQLEGVNKKMDEVIKQKLGP